MHSPRPYGLLTVGGELTQDDSASIELLARRLTNLKELSEVQSLRMVRALPDGGYVLAQDMGGVFRIITHKPNQKTKTVTSDGLAKDYIPMLYSGVITKSLLSDGEGLGMKLSEQTRRRLNNYDPNNLPIKNVRLQRFRIEYNDLVQEFVPEEETEKTHTQYVQQRPTWYSGAMAEVMQIVGGYGRQDINGLPDNAIERARFLLPAETLKLIQMELNNIRLPAYTGLPDVLGQFQYDYKFSNTDGVGFDDQSKPWLIKIDNRGVWAMPFPLIPATTTQAFKTYVVKVGDEELLKILDRFGGMPSGESFPKGDMFQAWERAGVVIKVCEVGAFYEHIAYSITCGWSFNLQGTEGFNTCYNYHANGLGIGLSYKLKLKLGHATNKGWQSPATRSTNPELEKKITNYLAQLFKLLPDNEPKNIAIKYKVRRTVNEAIWRDRVGRINPNWNDELNFWNNLVADPIATHAGSISEVGRGFLYSLEKPKFQPQIKFPDPLNHGCVSHNFTPTDGITPPSTYPNCDTIMYGYYIDDELKVVKYFYDGRGFVQSAENDYEECMIVGSWTQTETSGSTTNNGNFYTTDFDHRVPFAPTTTVTTIVGKDKGYDGKPFFAFDAFGSTTGTMWRNRYFTHKSITTTTENRVLKIGICIPYFCRNAVLHATSNSITGSSKSESMRLFSVLDPTTYRYWTYHFVFAWFGSLPIQNGKPYPVDGNPVWVEIEEYNPTPCSDFADQGSWISGLPADYAWLIHPKSDEWSYSGGGGPPKVQQYTKLTSNPSSGGGGLATNIIDGVGQILTIAPDKNYFLMSPDDKMIYFYRDGCRVVFGESVYANVSESGDGGGRKYWGYSSLADHRSAHHFIGVINE